MIHRLLCALGFAPAAPAPRPALAHYAAHLTCACGETTTIHVEAIDEGEAMNALALHVGAASLSVLTRGRDKGLVTHHGMLFINCDEAVRFVLHEWIDEDAPLPFDLPEGVTLSSAS